MVGVVRVETDLAPVQYEACSEPTILVVDLLSGERGGEERRRDGENFVLQLWGWPARLPSTLPFLSCLPPSPSPHAPPSLALALICPSFLPPSLPPSILPPQVMRRYPRAQSWSSRAAIAPTC